MAEQQYEVDIEAVEHMDEDSRNMVMKIIQEQKGEYDQMKRDELMAINQQRKEQGEPELTMEEIRSKTARRSRKRGRGPITRTTPPVTGSSQQEEQGHHAG